MASEVVCVTPGQRVGSTEQYAVGPGCQARGNYIYSSLAGYKRIVPLPEEEVSISLDLV